MIFSRSILSHQTHKADNLDYLRDIKPLFILATICFLYGISAGAYIHSLNIFLSTLNLSNAQIDKIQSIDILGGLVISPFVMFVVYKLGLYNLIILSLLLRTAGLVILVLVSSYELLCFGMFCFGVGGFVLYVCIFHWVNCIAINNVRATFISVAITTFGLGISMGPMILVFLKIDVGMIIKLSIITSLLIFFPLKSLKTYEPTYTFYMDTKLSRFFIAARIPIMCALASDFIFYAVKDFLPTFAMSHNYLQYQAYLLVGYFGLSGLFFCIPLGIILDKFNRIRILILLSLAIAVSVQLIPLVIDNLVFTLIIFLVLSTSINGIIISLFSILGDKFSGGNLILATSIVHAASTIGSYSDLS